MKELERVCIFAVIEALCDECEFCKAISAVRKWACEYKIPFVVADYLEEYIEYRKKKRLGL